MRKQPLLSVDWGTSALRMRLVEPATGEVLREAVGDRGVVRTFAEWEASGQERVPFYLSVLQALLPFDGPCVISGMASSSMGMRELPYAGLPFHVDGRDVVSVLLDGRILLVSGVRAEEDVMRGEETQLIGCTHATADVRGCFIFPGTHSKHILVDGDRATAFSTYMTGEFFSLLTRHSILAASVEDGEAAGSFREGVATEGLLDSAFRVRARNLFGLRSKSENYAFLSGLCIGAELRGPAGSGLDLTVVGDAPQRERYAEALRVLGAERVRLLDSAACVIRGHITLAKSQGLLPGPTPA